MKCINNNMSKAKLEVSPFVKWVGGKTNLLPTLKILFPKDFNRLVEPFLGGGSILFSFQPEKALINDLNKELIITYQTIKNDTLTLISLLKEYELKHSKSFYEEIRSLNVESLNSLEISARFIYLNKAGFNGLYRVNSNGKFNVPFGNKAVVKLFNEENLLAISDYLKSNNIEIHNKDYSELLANLKAGDFLFLDPPYDDCFTSYTKKGFNKVDQTQLLDFLKECDKRGVKWLLTNENTPFIRKLYHDYPHYIKKVNRLIKSKVTKEIFIHNYQLTPKQKKQLDKVKIRKSRPISLSTKVSTEINEKLNLIIERNRKHKWNKSYVLEKAINELFERLD